MPALVWLAALAARFLTAGVLRYVAMKLVAFTLLTVVLPIVLSNVFHKLIGYGMTLASEQATAAGATTAVVASFAGLAGWFLVKLRLPECVSLLMGGLAFKAAMSFIPWRR